MRGTKKKKRRGKVSWKIKGKINVKNNQLKKGNIKHFCLWITAGRAVKLTSRLQIERFPSHCWSSWIFCLPFSSVRWRFHGKPILLHYSFLVGIKTNIKIVFVIGMVSPLICWVVDRVAKQIHFVKLFRRIWQFTGWSPFFPRPPRALRPRSQQYLQARRSIQGRLWLRAWKYPKELFV